MGRPSTFNQKTGDKICLHIIEGLSLRSICALPEMPTLKTIMNWVSKDTEFLQQYTQARQMQADIKFDDLKDLAKTANPDNVQCVRLQIDTAKWELSKTLPKKYGEKIDIDMTADVTTHQYEITTKDDDDDIGYTES